MAGQLRMVTDSTCDLPPELVERYGIIVIPALIRFSNETYLDGIEITHQELYRRMLEEAVPKSSQPSPGQFPEAYKEVAVKGASVLSIHVTAERPGGPYAGDIRFFSRHQARHQHRGRGGKAIDKVRTRKKALDRVIELTKQAVGTGRLINAAVMHTAVEEEALGFKEKVRKNLNCQELFFGAAGIALGANAGPGVVGIMAHRVTL